MKWRYACKLFSTEKKLSSSDVSFLLECARLSPSSFGLEHWHLYAIETPAVITRLKDACFDQDAVGTASLAVVAMCRRGMAYACDSDFIRERGSRFPGGLETFIDDYRGYWEFLSANGLVDHWARSQCYIASANMMTGAASCGIDSCAIEGYDNEKVLDLLSLDAELWETGLITVFGYAAQENSREKIRMPSSRIITHV
jgi:nitroreductase